MNASITDWAGLAAISPAAVSAWARTAGWRKTDPFGDHSDIYVGEDRPEIVVPRTSRLADYPRVVARLLTVFAEAAETDELSLYRDLLAADRDVIRVRASGDSGEVPVGDGIVLLNGARDMLLAAACSLNEPRPLYRAGANREASDYVKRVRLGPTAPGSFVVPLLSPVIPPPVSPPLDADWPAAQEPLERRITKRLVEALDTARRATESANSGETSAFQEGVSKGVSANLCEALAALTEPFPALDVGISWARTLPAGSAPRTVRFADSDAPILKEAARSFRAREPRPEVRLFGFVERLRRDETDTDGTVSIRASVDDTIRTVSATLSQTDYERAVEAHKARAAVIADGDLERRGQRWYLRSVRIAEVITSGDGLGTNEPRATDPEISD